MNIMFCVSERSILLGSYFPFLASCLDSLSETICWFSSENRV